jgi:hypothetical protein
MKLFLSLSILILFTFSCNNTNSECSDCGGGILDGFIYKTVTLDDIGKLTEINLTASAGACIRAKLDSEGFIEAALVDDCCCSQYE